ncbi:B- and T-lymphocyte attenuator-like [Leptodactylus fuscus]|uniref:B- and T-lymphocyte attenuator-like n=1 Tax=Leptodactylus fuscus TaxID=238119 RepID=UPI003F4EB1C1
MARTGKIVKSAGQSLSLECLVQLCEPGLPNVTWCKITGDRCDPVRTGDGISTSMEEPREYNTVHVLKFDSVQINNTGYYQCKAVHKNQQIVGGTVQVNISGESSVENVTAINKTQPGDITDSTDKIQPYTLLLYVVSSMGGVCVLIITISLLVYCQRLVKAKFWCQDPARTAELQFVAGPGSPKKCPQTTQGSPAVTTEVTYDNAHLGYKSSTKRVSHPDEEDSIVYADLNHNAKRTGLQLEDDCEVEYATVHLSESRKHDL